MKRFLRLVRSLVLLVLLLALGWVGGLGWYGFTMPMKVADRLTRTDAIVVLTGGSDRLSEGIRLLATGYGNWLFVSGVNRKVSKTELMRVAGVTTPHLSNYIVIGQVAVNTRGNADETAAWLRSRKFRSIRLVTANYHMRRSLFEFRRALPQTKIVPHPVFPRPVNPGPWWARGRSLSIVAGEFNKYLAAVSRLAPDTPQQPQ